MDTELIRFKIDPSLRQSAASVCAELGLELNDVLRMFVTRIARDGALPFDVGGLSTRAEPRPGPFQQYNPSLWSAVNPPIHSRVAMSLLARFIGDCSEQLDTLARSRAPDPTLVSKLTRDRASARDLRRHLDVTDPDAVARVISTYGPLVRPGRVDHG